MSSISNTSRIYSVIEIAPVLPTEEPEYSLSIGDKHLSTIPETKSDEVVKSSVNNLVPILSEFEVTSDNEREYDVSVNDESSPIFTNFLNPLFDCNDDFTSSDDKLLFNEDVPMIYSNSLFNNEEIISTKIDTHYFNAESNLIESLLNQDTLIESSPKFDYLLEEFSCELAHIDPIPLGIEESDFDLEEEICLVENFLYDNSSPRAPEELNAKIADTIVESLSSSRIHVEDSHSQMEGIDLFLATNDLMPLGIENDDYDSEGDIHFLERLLSDDPLSLHENESSNFDHHDDLSFPSPPPEPPDVEIFFDFEPDTDDNPSISRPPLEPPAVESFFDLKPDMIAEEISNKLNEDKCFDPGREINVSTKIEDDDHFPFMFVIRFFLSYFIFLEVSPLLLSAESEDTIFDPGISN
nr:hypothetical protein [Tanacetum cinerariifolium]